MFKRINIPGIIALIVVLGAIQLGVGYFVSPMLKETIVRGINDQANAKIELERLRIWPLTLSTSIKGLAVYSKSGNEKIADIKNASLRLSFWALLSKRVVLSSVNLTNAEIFLKRSSDGSLNIAEAGKSPREAKKPLHAFITDRFKTKKDWFGTVYSAIKKVSSKEAADKKKEERKNAKKVTREVIEFPKGKIVQFKTIRDDYLLEITSLNIKNATIHMEQGADTLIDIENASIKMKKVVMDPLKGARFDALLMSGTLKKDKKLAGKFSLKYAESYGLGKFKTEFDFSGMSIDMNSVAFVYSDSLPVAIEKGALDISSKTEITDGALNSRNSLSLKDHQIAEKSGQKLTVGQFAMPLIVAALNKVNPIELKFNIGGTIDNPAFSGFQESLQKLIAPFIKEAQKEALGSASTKAQEAMSTVKSLFKKKE